MKYFISFLLIILSGISQLYASGRYPLIPYPKNLKAMEGHFIFQDKMQVFLTFEDKEIYQIASDFSSRLSKVSGLQLTISRNDHANADIVFTMDKSLGKEAYQLDVASDKIVVKAASPAGFFYAVQSIHQLLPPEICSPDFIGNKTTWSIPCVHILDEPRFGYRGMMLDVARYFMPKQYVLEFIDRLAAQKINYFHFHLTEDQGWRIEIKKYPRLTSIGAYRPYTQTGYKHFHAPVIPDGVEHQGFFTQEDIKEIVAYAEKRYITIIPEIELPGHSSAAVSAYPELSCGIKKDYEVVKNFGIFDNVFCPNEKTFQFLDDVFTEIAALFPGKYIHIGGDECPKIAWKQCKHCQQLIKDLKLDGQSGLQSYFVHRVEKILNKKGKRLIGWDEILEGGLAPNSTVMSWRGEQGGIKAAQSGHQVIMIPNADTYLNYYQEDPEFAPVGSGSFLPIEQVYRYNPLSGPLSGDLSQYVLGTEAALWTPYMKTPEIVDYYMYPRFYAFAEVAWGSNKAEHYQDFLANIGSHYKRLDYQSVNACRNYFDAYIDGSFNRRTKVFEVRMKGMMPDTEIRFTLNGQEPTSKDAVYTQPIAISKDTQVKAAVFHNEKQVGKITQKSFFVNKATGKNTFSSVPYRFKPDNPGAKDYSEFNFCGLTNGIRGYLNHVHPWVAFRPAEYTEIVVDLETVTTFKNIRYGVMNGYGQEAVAPESVEIEISNDSLSFKRIASKDFTYTIENKWQMFEQKFNFEPQKARYVKLKFKNGRLPYHLGGFPVPKEREGELGMLFIDEIEIK